MVASVDPKWVYTIAPLNKSRISCVRQVPLKKTILTVMAKSKPMQTSFITKVPLQSELTPVAGTRIDENRQKQAKCSSDSDRDHFSRKRESLEKKRPS